MLYMKERIFEVDEEGEEKVVDELSSTNFKRIGKMKDRKTAKSWCQEDILITKIH